MTDTGETAPCPQCGALIELSVRTVSAGCSGCSGGRRLVRVTDGSALDRHLREVHGEPA